MEIEDRLDNIEQIIHNLYNKNDLLHFFTYFGWKEFPQYQNNLALEFIKHNLIESLIIDFSKLLNKNEAFSFAKLINISLELKLKIDYSIINCRIEEIIKEYKSKEFAIIRDKHIAHLDLNAPKIQAKHSAISNLCHLIVDLFRLICIEFAKQPKPFADMNKSINEIFIEIRRLEEIKNLCIGTLYVPVEEVKVTNLLKIFTKEIKY